MQPFQLSRRDLLKTFGATVPVLASDPVSYANESDIITYSDKEIENFCKAYEVPNREFHFPKSSFLEKGYAPPGGYVKDFSVIRHNGRYHLFHIDGRPEERCNETGNEVSFGHASTTDFRHWIRHRMPIAVGDRLWENEHVWAPFVCRWRGLFYMFYMAQGRRTGQALTYATSKDLETWTKWQGGPLHQAEGRDPFVRTMDGRCYLYYTAMSGGIRVLATEDMVTFQAMPQVINNPERKQAESCSVHRLGDQYVLWYNDYYHSNSPSGDFRAVYAFSDNPLTFDIQELRVFDFQTTLPTAYAQTDWLEKRPIPISIELVEKSKKFWLVTYFRWHIDRFRLFFGALDWKKKPAKIQEIVSETQLRSLLKKMAKQ